jgi:hypothetical protein
MFFRIPDPTFFHPGSRIPDLNFFHPGSGSRISIKEFKYFNPRKWFLSSRKYDPGCLFRIPDLDPDFLSILDPRSRGQKGTGSRIPDPDPQYYPKEIYQFRGIDAWGPENFENSGSGSLSLHTNLCTLKNPRCKG